MGTLTPIADFAKAAFRIGVQPALFMAKRDARYRAAGLAAQSQLPVCRIDGHPHDAACNADCAYTRDLSLGHIAQYRALGHSWRFKPWLGTACVIALGDHKDSASYVAAIGVRTDGAIHRSCKKALRQGYVTGFFHPPYLRGQMSAILGSKRFRSGGFVPYALLGVRRAAADHGHVARYRPQPPCPLHWTLHWGVFAAQGLDANKLPPSQWSLVGFVKLRRTGSLVHALQIMGHGDHMAAGINDLMHMDFVRWLLENPDGYASGVTHYMYGALEHAGDGLAAWKLRRGFQPMLLSVLNSPHCAAR